ncbi:hypothetical protein LYSIN_01285 [Lysinibacillus sphaericus]|uniref:Uncharacterized protein n=1 Tax=Lysinibacillus sphaericus TaxID=1421 RepID=A0A2S5D0G6_LYSSH|nr:hypothetical protein LYSIN_01285 [Lysinibacillus sphaericus]
MKKRKLKPIMKNSLKELRNCVLTEIIWNIILWIPRQIFRLLKNIL